MNTSAKIVSVSPTKTSKIQLEFVEKIEKPSENLLAEANASDARFQQQKEQHAWLTGEVVDLKKLFPAVAPYIDECVKSQALVAIPGLPAVTGDGRAAHIRVTETTELKEAQVENVLKVAKRRTNMSSTYLHSGGFIIVSNKSIVTGNVNHTFIPHTGEADISELYANFKGQTVAVSSLIQGASVAKEMEAIAE